MAKTKESLNWTTVQRRIGDLKGYKLNPRKISESQRRELEALLKEFGLVEIPVINIDNTIIAGNQRIEILKLLGKEDEVIDVRFPNRKLTVTEVKRYAIVSNTHSGVFDYDLLDKHFAKVDLEGIESIELDIWKQRQFNNGIKLEDFFKKDSGSKPKPETFSVVLRFSEKEFKIWEDHFKGKTDSAEKVVIDLIPK